MTGKGGVFKGDPFKRNFSTYKETLRDICKHELEKSLAISLMEHYFKDGDHLSGLSYEIAKNFENNHLYFCDIIEYLNTIMSYNVDVTEGMIFDVTESNNILSLSDPIFRNIKSKVTGDLRDEIKSYEGDKLSRFAASFLRNMSSNKKDWRLTDDVINPETVLVESFRSFIKGVFSKYVTDSFSDYLELAYREESEQQKDALASKIVEKLLLKAALPFIVWGDNFDFSLPTL
jgi:hypothetical protein